MERTDSVISTRYCLFIGSDWSANSFQYKQSVKLFCAEMSNEFRFSFCRSAVWWHCSFHDIAFTTAHCERSPVALKNNNKKQNVPSFSRLNLLSRSIATRFKRNTTQFSVTLCFHFRLTVKTNCKMLLHNYPLDSQTCPMYIGSCKLRCFSSAALRWSPLNFGLIKMCVLWCLFKWFCRLYLIV